MTIGEIITILFILVIILAIVVSAVVGSKKDKPKRDQYWTEYKRFQDKVVNGEAMTEEDIDFAAKHHPESMMETLLGEMRNHRVTKEEFQVRRMVIWKMEELKEEKWRLEAEEKATHVQEVVSSEEQEEKERQLAQLKQQLDAGLIDKAEYEEKRRSID